MIEATARPATEGAGQRLASTLGAPGLRADVALTAALALVATAVRLPYLWLMPRFTDETLEVLHSLAIVRDGSRPLTNYDSYYGALYNYLVALALAVSGESPLAPRVVVLVGGLLTVLMTYGLGRALAARVLGEAAGFLAARMSGLLAGGLLATNGAHVVVNSHVAWSNCLTPLFTTAALWAILAWYRPSPSVTRNDPVDVSGARHGRIVSMCPICPGGVCAQHTPAASLSVWERVGLLPLAGLLLGLALQTHPLVVTLLPGVAVAVLRRRWGLLRTPWPWLAAACFALGYANMIAFNLENGFESIGGAQRIRSEYAQDQQASTGYLPTAASMALLLARILGGAVDQRSSSIAYVLDPSVLLMVGLAAAGIWLASRRGELLPLAVTASFLLILPAFNPKFTTLITSRYLMPIVPLLFACASLALVVAVRTVADRRPALRSAARSVGVGIGLALVLLPLVALSRYYDRTLARSDTNERILRLTSEIQAARRPAETVLIDDGIGSELPDTGVTELRGFEYLLTFDRVPFRPIKPSAGRFQDELDREATVLAVLNARDAAAAGARVRLDPLDARPPVESGRQTDYRLYRLSRARA